MATSTTGLMAGADSMNVSAAAPETPSPNSRRATGTEPHSQPGSAAPPTRRPRRPPQGTGSQRASRSTEQGRDQTADHHTQHQEGQRLDEPAADTVAATPTSALPATKPLIAPADNASAMSEATRPHRPDTPSASVGRQSPPHLALVN